MIPPRILPLFFLASVLPICAATFQVNLLDSQGADSVAYTGDQQDNLVSVDCGTSASLGGYAFCDAELLGDLLTNTRASVISPSLPFGGPEVDLFDILDDQSAVSGIIEFAPEAGCTSGGETVTCGVSLFLATSLDGDPLSSSFLSSLSGSTLVGSATEDGSDQTAFTLDWSNGRVDNVNFEIAQAPEPSSVWLLFAGVAVLAGVLQNRRKADAPPVV